MKTALNTSPDAKELFKKCGTCSQAFAHLINNDFGNTNDIEELALDPLAGGIFNEGQQCGMLWGASLAAGKESYKRFSNTNEAKIATVKATQQLVKSFEEESKTIICRDLTGLKLNTFFGMARFMIKTMVIGMEKSPCFTMSGDWGPKAITAANKGVLESRNPDTDLLCCASELIKIMGGSDEEAHMVSGFSGGLGLTGFGCGALSAAIWYKTLQWCREHSGETPPFFKNSHVKKMIKSFKKYTLGELNCTKISGRKFSSAEEHSKYIQSGGCKDLLEHLVQVETY